MFKKKPQIKNLSPLRSSDRRKLADQIISDYRVPVPTPAQVIENAESSDIAPQPQITLTSIRTSLLPESTSSARFTTTSGPNATPVSGTVYVGAHPGQDERILWFQLGKDSRLIPTVYTLWHNPNVVPLLHAADFVVEDKLKAGADLMTPGLLKSRAAEWDARAKKGSVVAVAGVGHDTVPLWVGYCEIDISALGNDLRGVKGAAVKGLHWEGDELWAWSTVGKGGQTAPESIEGWVGVRDSLNEAVLNLDLDDEDEDGQGGVALDKSVSDLNGNAKPEAKQSATTSDDQVHDEEDDKEPTTKEIDDAFYQAFLYSLHMAMKQNQPPSYGFDFPLQPSFLIANMIQPHLRFQNQHYTIKKTSWKNTKKFIKFLDKKVLVKSKDRNGGETVILDIDFDDQQIKDFQPYKLPKPKPKSEDINSESTSASAGGDPSIGQTLQIQLLYRASSKLVPDLLDSKTTFYTSPQITSALKGYIEANTDLTAGVSTSRNIRLDPFIANNILGSNSSSADLSTLRAGEIDRGTLNRRLLDDDHLCVPYHVILRNQTGYDPSDSALKPKPGPAPKIHITIEKRTGTKTVTKLSNLEPYFINPQLLAPELQKKCAGSASIGQHVGGKPGMMEITVQGDQRDILVRDVLAKRGVQAKWVDVTDKTKKGKGK